MREKNENDPVEIFAGTSLQASMIKSVLENAEIEAFLKDDIVGTLNPWWTDPGGAGSVKVLVALFNYEKAKGIVDEYIRNINSDI